MPAKYLGTPWDRSASPVLLGFLSSYFFFFVVPVFLNPDHAMKFFQYIPVTQGIGVDLLRTVQVAHEWLVDGKDPYLSGLSLAYPPLTILLFSILGYLDPAVIYGGMTALTFFLYVFSASVFPWLMAPKRVEPVVAALILVTGLFSYAFQFELERGQFNVLAASCAFLSIWMFHHHPRWRIWAYGFFSLAVQLKLYPAIFLFALIRDRRSFVGDLGRLSILALVNAAIFFVMGPSIFLSFLKGLAEHSFEPYVWVGNHSLKSYGSLNPFKLINIWEFNYHGPWVGSASTWTWAFFVLVTLGCLAWMIIRAFRPRGAGGRDPYLILTCTLVALLLPSTSHDYTLAIMAGPVALAYYGMEKGPGNGPWWPWLDPILKTVFFFAYASTLFSYAQKPPFFKINTPALLVILVVAVVSAWLGDRTGRRR